MIRRGIKVILWDFDGVLLDSMKVWENGFRSIFSEYDSRSVESLVLYHHDNGGLSRYVRFGYFYEKILGRDVLDHEVQELADRYSRNMMVNMLNPRPMITETVEFVRVYYGQIFFHIVSGSDGVELNEICCKIGLEPYFKTIIGSPRVKSDLIRDVLTAFSYDRKEVALIGDSKNDLEAARETGVQLFGYNNPSLESVPVYLGGMDEMVNYL